MRQKREVETVYFNSDEYISLPYIMFRDELCAEIRKRLAYLGNNVVIDKGSKTVRYSDYIKLDSDNDKLVRDIYSDSLKFPDSTLKLKALDDTRVYGVLTDFHTNKLLETWIFERG